MKKRTFGALSLLAIGSAAAHADIVAQFPMDVRSGQIVESVSRERFAVQGHFAPENLPGAVGNALRFDGYTSYIDARLGDVIPSGSDKMTVSMWVALPCYPIIKIDTDTSEKTAIATCIDETARTGFGFFIGFDGKWSFKTFVGGWPVEISVDEPMPTYQWNCLTAVVDTSARSVKLYNNGEEVGSSRCNGAINMTPGAFKIGRGDIENYSGPFLLTSFNGLVDDITIYNEAIPQATIRNWKPENPANLDIPASRFADDILRPRFHGMPAAAWTNECHGMYFADGRYHLFFQKNADGPYMARLHWGHISSENLYDWREEKIAIAPGAWYDIKGCWSGCVFSDDALTGGRPNIIYTAVDYGRATIAQALPDDKSLENWSKKSTNPIIGGRPANLGDDFRDPYFFRNGDDAYIIVGSSINGVGTTTLHKYNSLSGLWSNDGTLFFTGSNAALDGNFWEMPTITPMGDGRWLFTATPLSTSVGTKTHYWTGKIGADGKFTPDAGFAAPKNVELAAREGFGLLSPTIYQHEDKTIVLGIVPDKLGSQENWNLGWAHCYSLPREWSLDEDGVLVQKPFAGLTGLRTAQAFSRTDFDLDGALSLSPVSGREIELEGRFIVGPSQFGFSFFKNSTAEATLTYNPSRAELTVDFSRLHRLINDGGVFDGIYRCTLPERPRTGDELKINVFVDHSIVDIFVNDRWATSIRVFPTDEDANGVEAFASGGSLAVKSLKAWNLSKDGGDTGIGDVVCGQDSDDDIVDVYNISGICMKQGVRRADATSDLHPGIYIVGNKKVEVK